MVTVTLLVESMFPYLRIISLTTLSVPSETVYEVVLKPTTAQREYYTSFKTCWDIYYNYWYRDYELTEDIDKYLPVGKTLYVIVDACHSAGMINLWHLDTRLEKSVAFFCGANTEIYSRDDPNARGGLFTNSFCRHAKIGRPLWEIADKVLQEIFSPSETYARSSSIRYSHPAMAVRTFCEN